jgi:hypothetical protein
LRVELAEAHNDQLRDVAQPLLQVFDQHVLDELAHDGMFLWEGNVALRKVRSGNVRR